MVVASKTGTASYILHGDQCTVYNASTVQLYYCNCTVVVPIVVIILVPINISLRFFRCIVLTWTERCERAEKKWCSLRLCYMSWTQAREHTCICTDASKRTRSKIMHRICVCEECVRARMHVWMYAHIGMDAWVLPTRIPVTHLMHPQMCIHNLRTHKTHMPAYIYYARTDPDLLICPSTRTSIPHTRTHILTRQTSAHSPSQGTLSVRLKPNLINTVSVLVGVQRWG